MKSIREKTKAMKRISKTCYFCKKPIRFWHRTIGCCGTLDYVRDHRSCHNGGGNKMKDYTKGIIHCDCSKRMRTRGKQVRMSELSPTKRKCPNCRKLVPTLVGDKTY